MEYSNSKWHASQSIEFNDQNKNNLSNRNERKEENNIIEFRSNNGKIVVSNIFLNNKINFLLLRFII